MKPRRKYFLKAVIAGIVIFAASCTNLTAVREWSKTSVEATQYDEIVATYADTPQRLKRYDPSGPWEDQIALRKNQAAALSQILSVVSDYMAALTALSGDSLIDYKKDVDALTTGLGKLNAGISTETIGAVGSLVKTILGASVQLYQARQVATIVERANAPLQVILGGELRLIVDQDFRRDLKIERTFLDRYYDAQLQTGRASDAAKIALGEWKEVRLEQNAERLKAIDAYLEVLDNVSEGHQQLYNNRNKLDAKTLTKDLYSLTMQLRKQIKILIKS
jgi:hypothetical protein